MTATIASPLAVRGVELSNRIGVSPMCQYSSRNGLANDWHLVHLGARAVGGAGLVVTEATAVTPVGRISPDDLGLWSDEHAEAMAPIAKFISAQGSVPGVQLAHAGRKASTAAPWKGEGPLTAEESGWVPLGCSDEPFSPRHVQPRAMNEDDLEAVPAQFAEAAVRAKAVGFRWIDLHAAHGYLFHEFLSPLSNRRSDRFGDGFEGRALLLLTTAAAVREAIGETMPLAVRLSATDWVEGGWTIEETIALSRCLREVGVDLIDCSSGGNSSTASIPVGPGYQVSFAERVRDEAGVLTAAVGMITDSAQADEIVRSGRADLVLVGRAMLRDPNWSRRALEAARRPPLAPDQYALAYPKSLRRR